MGFMDWMMVMNAWNSKWLLHLRSLKLITPKKAKALLVPFANLIGIRSVRCCIVVFWPLMLNISKLLAFETDGLG